MKVKVSILKSNVYDMVFITPNINYKFKNNKLTIYLLNWLGMLIFVRVPMIKITFFWGIIIIGSNRSIIEMSYPN